MYARLLGSFFCIRRRMILVAELFNPSHGVCWGCWAGHAGVRPVCDGRVSSTGRFIATARWDYPAAGFVIGVKRGTPLDRQRISPPNPESRKKTGCHWRVWREVIGQRGGAGDAVTSVGICDFQGRAAGV